MKKLSMNRCRFPCKKGIFIILLRISRTDHTFQVNGSKKELPIDEKLKQLSEKRYLSHDGKGKWLNLYTIFRHLPLSGYFSPGVGLAFSLCHTSWSSGLLFLQSIKVSLKDYSERQKNCLLNQPLCQISIACKLAKCALSPIFHYIICEVSVFS